MGAGGARGDGRLVRFPGTDGIRGSFLGRFEVTLRMDLADLNDRGWHAANAAAARVPMRGQRPGQQPPILVADAAGVFHLRAAGANEEWPLYGISLADAVDYAAWVDRQGAGPPLTPRARGRG